MQVGLEDGKDPAPRHFGTQTDLIHGLCHPLRMTLFFKGWKVNIPGVADHAVSVAAVVQKKSYTIQVAMAMFQ